MLASGYESYADRVVVGDDARTETVTLTQAPPWDVFEDGYIDTKDSILLAQYLAGWSAIFSDAQKQAADVYEDGVIDAKDSIYLAQYLAGWDVW